METKPWGSYTVLDEGLDYKVKQLTVNPGGTLSLQSHKLRSEHWVVVKGTPTVTKGIDVLEIPTGSSIFIPKEFVHRITNETNTEVIIIETQIGTCDEDDIVRYADIYDRT